MIELNMTLLIQLVNFLILLAVLNLIIFRPIRGVIKKRSERMAADLTEIEQFNEQAKNKMEDYEASLQKARQEGTEIRSSYKEEGLQEEKKIVGQAKEEASQELEQARSELSQQAEKAQKNLHKQVDKYAKLVADKILA